MMYLHPVFPHQRIYAPGPTPIPDEVKLKLATFCLHHRSPDFSDILERVKKNLAWLFQTKERVYLFAASGTGAMEACVVNLFAPGDEVLVVNAGKFGERWQKITARYGMHCHEIKVEWGKAVEPNQIRDALQKFPRVAGVLLQATESSTGAWHPVEEVSKVIKSMSSALVVVDAITALGVVNLPMDSWQLDAVVGGSQKALMLPPGLSFLALSQNAQKRRKSHMGCARFYFDLELEDKAYQKGETAFTPSVGIIQALDLVLKRFQEVGLTKIFQHYERLAQATRAGVTRLGFELFAKESPSQAITSIRLPSILHGKPLTKFMRDQFKITLAGGQDDWKGKLLRIAHLGHYDVFDILVIMAALEQTSAYFGYPIDWGSSIAEVQRFFSGELQSHEHLGRG